MAISDSGYVSTTSVATRHPPGLLELPTELIDTIFSYLTPPELARQSVVCRKLGDHATNNLHWRRHVLSNLPGNKIKTPYPCRTWRELFVAHDQYWFLTKHKLWFCDHSLTGQLVIARYDERRGCIEGYQLVATRSRDGSEPWLADQDVNIQYFEPEVKLHLDKPILQFNVGSLENLIRIKLSSQSAPTRSARRFFPEHPMSYTRGTDPRFSTFVLAKPLEGQDVARGMMGSFPYNLIWPPPTIPAPHRVLGYPIAIGYPTDHHTGAINISSASWRPANRSEASDQTFRIRQWMEMGTRMMGLHTGEEIVTYATLDPSL
jgi:hypothetical protein